MPNPTSLFVATALVAIPSTAGIYHLATSSSTKTVEQEELNEERKAQESEVPKDPVGSETEQPPVVEEKPSGTELPEAPSLGPVSDQGKVSKQENTNVVEMVKQAFSNIKKDFPYDKVETENEARTDKFETFVRETDKIRDSITAEITKLFNQKGHENEDIKDLVNNVLGFSVIGSDEESLWSRLVQIRKEEASTQADIDINGVSRLSHAPTGDDVTKDNILNFCLDPSKGNSHLGMYDLRRKEKEETKEYRLFTYYSYCTKESYYLSDKLNFWKVS